ncbi:MAG: M48 family metalloprotease, partial [Pseudomonadota bacterium]
ADVYALNMMNAAGADAEALANFFDSLSGLERTLPDLPEYLSTHPETADRAAAARAYAKGQGRTSPILNAADWKDLQDICKAEPAA